MKLKALAVVAFIALIGLASLGIYTFLNMGDRGIQEEQTCELQCTSNVTTERREELSQELKSEHPEYNLSRTGEKVHCPCTNSTTLKYEVLKLGAEVGLLVNKRGNTEITISRRIEIER